MSRSDDDKPKAKWPKWYPRGGKNPYGEAITADGEHNVLYWAWELSRCNTYAVDCLNKGIDASSFTTKRTKQILDTAKAKGIDLKSIGSDRASLALLEAPDELFEQTEAKLTRMEEEATKLLRQSNHIMEKMLADGELTPIPLSPEQKKRLDRVLSLIRRVRDMNAMCRDRSPSDDALERMCGEDYEYCWRDSPHPELIRKVFGWTRPMRIMLWSMRNDNKGWSPVYEMTRHMTYASFRRGLAIHRGQRGFMVAIPPRHGKTDWLFAICVDEFADDQEINMAFIHNRSEDATIRCERVRNMMSPDNPEGRRVLALFPQLRVLSRRENKNSSSRFTLQRKSASTEPSMRAAGIYESAEGKTLHRIKYDDIVAAKERLQETTRDQTWQAFIATWQKRLTGGDAFFDIACTFWHHDDTYARLRKNLRVDAETRVPDIEIVIMPCGDIHNGGKDPCIPLWDKYPRPYLNRTRRDDHTLYACTHLLDPQPEELKIIRKLHFVRHDPEMHEEDQKFVDDSQCILSIDPTATTKKGSDKAGVIYALVNPYIPEIRIIGAEEVPMNQVELSEYIKNVCLHYPVHEIIVETIGGFHATADMLELDLPQEMIVRMLSTGREKSVRLRACAIHFENGRVTFAGVAKTDEITGEVSIEPNPEHEWLYKQLLNFGAVKEDHAVDGITQLLKHKADLLRDSMPEASDQLRERGFKPTADPRIAKHIQGLLRRRRQPTSPCADEFASITAESESDLWEPSWN